MQSFSPIQPAKAEPVKEGKARPRIWTRLALLLLLSLCLGLLGSQAAEFALSFRRETVRVEAQISRALPVAMDQDAGKLDVNRASAKDFQGAFGIGPALSQAIVDYRDSAGGFFYIEELMDVPSIGEKRFAVLRELFCCPADGL